MNTTWETLARAIACSLLPAALGAQVVIHEIHYDPPVKTAPEEFVELHNAGGAAVDISGWAFTNGISFTFPPGTAIAPGGFLVVAENPAALRARFGSGIPVVGPWTGRLDNSGERLVIRNAQGGLEDEVSYGIGFPWPTVGDLPGYSIELLNPDLDNDLGGSWRASDPGLSASSTLVRGGEVWKYLEGTREASSPSSAWRGRDFDDASWAEGRTSIGYGEDFIATPLADMQGNYASVYLRKAFDVADPSAVSSLLLEVQYDDGFNAWINGAHVAGANVASAEMAHDATASSALEDFDFKHFPLAAPSGYLVAGRNVLAIQFHNSSLGASSDAFLDARLLTATGSGVGPTPGARNSVAATNVPPKLRQVAHAPETPFSGQPVLITVKATDRDGVSRVTLEYQVVHPGYYIELNDPEYALGWTAIEMNDAGTLGDVLPGDGTYSAMVPGGVQSHRRLVRYRIHATDGTGLSVTVPYPDDPEPNFAYFVHDGLVGWSGAIQPGSTDPNRRRVVDYTPELLGSIPSYFLITKRSATEDCTWYSKYGGDLYRWSGTIVHEGKVYDHIRYRARGGVWRYAMGKNMWKFDFLRGHSFQARDDFGRKYGTRWDKLNFSAVIQQGDYLHRGEQGLFEAVGFRLFNLAGVAAPKTNFALFLIVDEEEEFGASQYVGDLWGLYLVLEQMDGRFLDEHDLPDGNFYKMEGGTGELNNQGPTGATDRSDLNLFLNTYQNTSPSDAWWRQNLDLDGYYSYRSIVEAIHHYDIGYGKNYFYYLHPETGIWAVLPWDIDLTWANNMFGDGNEPFKSRVLSRAAFSLEYRNRIRELRDLLYNSDQTNGLIDEFAAMIDDPEGGPSIVDLDRAMWDYNPVMVNSSIVNLSKAGHGRFYQQSTTKDFPGMVALMKSYVASRGGWIDTNVARDAAIPDRPTVTSTSPAGYPIDALTFRASAFSDPQGTPTFAAMKWRIGEVAPSDAPPFDPAAPRPYEVEAVWESPELTNYGSDVSVPTTALAVGKTYRIRVRMMDDTARWSRWSAPVEFLAGPATARFPAEDTLRVTELMFHPAGDPDAEFIELQNVGSGPLDLSGVSFTAGVDFRFEDGTMLPPGEHIVVVADLAAFRARYGTAGIRVAGEYRGRLENGGERIALTFGASTTILDFTYRDRWYPLAAGAGYSLVVVDPWGPTSAWTQAAGWTESAEFLGSPGRGEESGPPRGLQLPGDANQDGVLDISDALSLLLRLFVGTGRPLPCEGGLEGPEGNARLLDVDGDGEVRITDAIGLLSFLFQSGPAPALGTECVRIEGCPNVCGF